MENEPAENLALFDVEEVPSSKCRNRPLYGQVLVALMTYGATMCAGLTGGYSGILLHQLRSNSSDLQIDDNMASWIVSVYTGGTSLGCISCGIIINLAGRRTGAQTANVTMAIGWLVIAFSNSIPIMLVGRAIDGFGKGAIAVAATRLEGRDEQTSRVSGTERKR